MPKSSAAVCHAVRDEQLGMAGGQLPVNVLSCHFEAHLIGVIAMVKTDPRDALWKLWPDRMDHGQLSSFNGRIFQVMRSR